jgi:16S rRNA (cytosine967-C5)-methyltransferase
MIAPARVAAYETLRAVETARADLPHALAHARAPLRDERDRALAGEIATGTLRWQGTFDHLASQFTGRPAARLDPEVRVILQLTMFQLLHLDRVPASAAVNDAVSLARRAGKRSAAPLVNAVLRRVSRERNRLPLPSRPSSGADREAALDYLSIALSHPRWLVARWLDRYGFESAEAWARFNNAPAGLTLRANRLRNSREALAVALRDAGVETAPARFAPDGLVVTRGNPLLSPLADRGLFVVQDEASQLVTFMAAVHPGERVFDACASPGGKTTAMAATMNDRGLIVAADVRPRRIELLVRMVAASNAGCIRVVRADAAGPLPFGPVFDCVLLDAPCTGLGTVRRDPDVKWRRSESAFPALAARQLEMLRSTGGTLKPGGRLVYSTCSSEPEENEEVVRRFAAESGFSVTPPSGLPAAMRPLVNGMGHLRTYPFRDGLEAFFAAVLRRVR